MVSRGRSVRAIGRAFGPLVVAGLVASAIVLVVAVAAGLLLSLVEGAMEPDDAIWWAFLRLTDPGYLGDDEAAVESAASVEAQIAQCGQAMPGMPGGGKRSPF